ncbi:unnamed protein product [Meloidogyne enterolobii]|uniref:Uncharacterized protein n=1 Tax=Meloidogyne enterolobii TaxID=390850 RepID=A0ACB1ATB7_MELEN
MFKFLILICLIIKTHSWTWEDYPSPRGPNYSKCGVSRPSNVCDPDGMLTDKQRKEIVELPKSKYQYMREGLGLIVALAKNKIGYGNISTGLEYLCSTDNKWQSSDETTCQPNVHGIELNTDGFRYCYSLNWLMSLHSKEFEHLNKSENYLLNSNNYFDALKSYIEGLRMLYNHRFSIFDNHDAPNEDNITLSEVHHSLQDTKKTLAEMRKSLDQQNKTLSDFHIAMEETNKKLSKMEQLLRQDQMISGEDTSMEEEKEG